MKKIIFLYFTVFGQFITAQNIQIFDLISNTPIENVSINYNTIGATTNIQGRADVSKFNFNDTLTISHISYHTVNIKKGQLNQKLYLKSKSLLLPTINLEINKIGLIDDLIICSAKVSEIIRVNKSTTEILEGNLGITVQESQSGGGSPNYRGMEANRLLLVVDNIPLNNAIYRSGHLQSSATINPFFINEIKIVSGPSSVAYGNGAMGGALVFQTHTNTNINKNNFYIQQQTESATNGVFLNFLSEYHYQKIAFTSAFSLKELGNLKMGKNRIHSYENWGNEHVSTSDNEQLFTAYKQADFMHKTYYSFSENSSILFNTQFATSSNINRFDKLNDIKNGLPKYSDWYYGPQKRFLQSIKYSNFKENLLYNKFNTLASYQNITESRHKRKYGESELSNRIENILIYDLAFDFQKSYKKINLNYGAGIREQQIESKANITTNNNTFYNASRYPDGGSSAKDIYAYGKLKLPINKKIKLTIGSRYNQNYLQANFEDTLTFNFPFNKIKNNNSSLIKSINLSFKIGNKNNLNLAYYGGFRNPNIDDIGKVFSKNDSYVVVPNVNLEAEYANNYELSFLRKNETLTLNTALFFTEINNAINREFSTINGNDSMIYDGEMMRIQMNKNIESATIYGLNINANYKLNKSLTFKANYNYLKGLTMEKNPLSHIPPINGKFYINYKYKKNQFELFTKFNAEKKATEYDSGGVDNLEEATIDGSPAWYTLNFSYNSKIDDTLSFSIAIENITDIHYKTFGSGLSASGRNIILSLCTNF